MRADDPLRMSHTIVQAVASFPLPPPPPGIAAHVPPPPVLTGETLARVLGLSPQKTAMGAQSVRHMAKPSMSTNALLDSLRSFIQPV